MNLIRIVDNLNDEEYIYSNNLNISLQQAAVSLLKDTKWSLYTLCEDKCEIFINEEVIQRGWVWNSKNTTKKILYELSYIPCRLSTPCRVEQKPTQIEQGVQTEDCKLPTTENCNYINFGENGFFHQATGYSNNPFDPVNTLRSTFPSTLPSIDFDGKGTLLSKTNIWSNPQHKYAINYTAPTDLNIEIERRLALPNFGLRRFKQD